MNIRNKRRIYSVVLVAGALALLGVFSKYSFYSDYKIGFILGIGLVIIAYKLMEGDWI